MSKRTYVHISELLPEVQRLKSQGHTNREIATILGLSSKKMVENLLYRQQKRSKTGQPPKQRGRKPAVTLQDYRYECKRLKMENELLRDFLYLAGRR